MEFSDGLQESFFANDYDDDDSDDDHWTHL